MRIEALRLPAYGPFTGEEFDFSTGRGRLELIYGANEAGKTSLLRGISALLFGIPGQTADAFIHPYGELRIGGTLEHQGKRISFLRRKANKKTLRLADDLTVLADEEFREFVPVPSEQFFQLMFGLDAQRLQEGGEELLAGKGEFGSLLFGAATGIVGLRKVQEDINQSAEQLFRPKASSTAIMKAVSRREDSRKKIKEAAFTATRLEDLYRQEENAAVDLERLRTQLASLTAEISRLDRLTLAIDLLNRRRKCLDDLKTFGSAMLLRESFPKEFEEIAKDAQANAAEIKQVKTGIQVLETALQGLSFSAPLVSARERVNSLNHLLGAETKAQADKPNLIVELNAIENRMCELLTSLGEAPDLERVPSLNVPDAEAGLADHLAERCSHLQGDLQKSQSDVAEHEQDIGDVSTKLDALAPEIPGQSLRDAYEGLLAMAQLNIQLPLRRSKLAKNRDKLTKSLQALPWQHGLVELAQTQFPAQALVQEWSKRLKNAADEVDDARGSLQEARESVEQCEAVIQRLQTTRRLSTLDDLHSCRSYRDLGWQAIRHAWLDSNLESSEAQAFLSAPAEPPRLAEEYTGSVLEADRVADDLREHAEEVAQLTQVQADLGSSRRRLAARSADLSEALDRHRLLTEEWTGLWEPAGLAATAPEQMFVWLANRQTALEEDTRLTQEQDAIDDESAKLLSACGEVQVALLSIPQQVVPEGADYAELKSAAANALSRLEKEQKSRQTLLAKKESAQEKLRKAQLKLEEAQRKMAEWKDQWHSLLTRLRLSGSTEVGAVKKTLSLRSELSAKYKEAARLRRRILHIDRDTRDFEAQVSALIIEVAPELVGRAAPDAVADLHAKLQDHLNIQSLRQEKGKDLASARDRLASAETENAGINARMGFLLTESDCASAADVPERIEQSRHRRELEEKRRDIEDQLYKISSNGRLDELEAQAAAIPPDSIPGKIEELKAEVDSANKLRDDALTAKSHASKQIQSLADCSVAAAAAADFEAARAEILELTETYVRLSMASQILNKAVSDYTSHASGPMLSRSSAIFSTLTRGSFSGLQPEVDGDRTVLVGVRPNGKQVPMEGMSDGTRDQLYLALRVASLELYFEKQPPVPLILDDLLVHFDDERARSALEVLSSLALKTQVLLFSHHLHVAELARECLPEDNLSVYRIGGTAVAR